MTEVLPEIKFKHKLSNFATKKIVKIFDMLGCTKFKNLQYTFHSHFSFLKGHLTYT